MNWTCLKFSLKILVQTLEFIYADEIRIPKTSYDVNSISKVLLTHILGNPEKKTERKKKVQQTYTELERKRLNYENPRLKNTHDSLSK